MRLRNSTPTEYSCSVNFTSRAKACMWRTKDDAISRSRAFGAPSIAASTTSVTSSAVPMTLPLVFFEVVLVIPHLRSTWFANDCCISIPALSMLSSGWRCSGRAAHDKRGCQHDVTLGRRQPRHLGNKELGCFAAHLAVGNTDRRQGRRHDVDQRHVIVANDRNVLRAFEPALTQRLVGSQSQQVVRRGDGREVRMSVEEATRRRHTFLPRVSHGRFDRYF